MPRRILRAAAMAAAVLPAAWAAAAPLSLDQALDLAVQRSQAARSARAGSHGAAEIARAAGQQPDPMLSVGIDNLPATGPERFSTTAEGMTMKRIGIAQEWVPADKRAAREALANARAGRESVMAEVAAAETRLQTALAYLDAHFAAEALKLTTLNETHAREELEAARGRLASVAGRSADVLALTGALGLAEDESGDVRQQQAAAAVSLQRWVGRAADELAPPPVHRVPSQADYVAAHPVVRVRQRELDVARREVELTRLNRRPSWTWEVAWGQRQGAADMVSFGVRIPWPVAPAARQDRETAAALALVEKSEAELEEARRAAAGEHAAFDSDLGRLEARTERFRAAVLVPLEQRTAATLAAYRSNTASLVMLFEARHAHLDAQRRLLGLQRDLAKARAQLVFKPISEGTAP